MADVWTWPGGTDPDRDLDFLAEDLDQDDWDDGDWEDDDEWEEEWEEDWEDDEWDEEDDSFARRSRPTDWD